MIYDVHNHIKIINKCSQKLNASGRSRTGDASFKCLTRVLNVKHFFVITFKKIETHECYYVNGR